jgi:hypothetical protein
VTQFGDGQVALSFGTVAQQITGQGDDTIDWGYQYTAFDATQQSIAYTIAGSVECRSAFNAGQPLPSFDTRKPRQAQDDWPVSSLCVSIHGGIMAVSENHFFYWHDTVRDLRTVSEEVFLVSRVVQGMYYAQTRFTRL